MKYTILILILSIAISSFGQKFTISSAIQNILYKGIDNPIDIVIEDTKCKNIIISTTNGNISKYNECKYSFTPDSIGEVEFSIYKRNKNDSFYLGSYKFKVKNIPNPIPKLANVSNGEIDLNLLLSSKCITASIDGFGFDVKINIRSFNVFLIKGNDSVIYKNINGNKFTDELINEFINLKSGDVIYFVDIIAVLSDGKESSLTSMKFKIK